MHIYLCYETKSRALFSLKNSLTCLSSHLFIYLSIHLFIYLSIHLSILQSIYLCYLSRCCIRECISSQHSRSNSKCMEEERASFSQTILKFSFKSGIQTFTIKSIQMYNLDLFFVILKPVDMRKIFALKYFLCLPTFYFCSIVNVEE